MDPKSVLKALVLPKQEFRHESELNELGELAFDVPFCTSQALKAVLHQFRIGRGLIKGQDQDENSCLFCIPGDLDLGYGDRGDARILQVTIDENIEFIFHDRLNALNANGVHGNTFVLEFLGYHVDLIGFDEVSDFDVVVAIDSHPALIALVDFFCVVLEALE